MFNVACCHDNETRIGKASEIYKEIVAEEPGYTDAYLRLAFLAKGRGDMKRAIEYIDTAKNKLRENPKQ